MSKKMITKEAEDDAFAAVLQKVKKTPPEKRGPAGQAIMAAFQIYFDMIGGAVARTKKETR